MLIEKLIEGSDYNGHSQLEVKRMSLETLMETYKVLDEDYGAVEIRFMYNGSRMGTWGASFYSLCHWGYQEHPLGHQDKLLLTVEHVEGFPNAD